MYSMRFWLAPRACTLLWSPSSISPPVRKPGAKSPARRKPWRIKDFGPRGRALRRRAREGSSRAGRNLPLAARGRAEVRVLRQHLQRRLGLARARLEPQEAPRLVAL